MKKFIGYTVGLIVSGPSLSKDVLAKVEFSELKSGKVELSLVSGNNLSKIKAAGTVVVSKEEYLNRDYDAYDSTAEAKWALQKLSLSC